MAVYGWRCKKLGPIANWSLSFGVRLDIPEGLTTRFRAL